MHDARLHAFAEQADRAVQHHHILRVALQVVLVIDQSLERRRALARGDIGIAGMQPVEVIDWKQSADPDDVGGETAQFHLLFVLEHVVGDPIDRGQLRPIDPRQHRQIVLARLLLGGGLGVGQELAEPIGVAQVAAEQRLQRIALQAGLVAGREQRLQLRILNPLARQRGGRGRRLGGERRGERSNEQQGEQGRWLHGQCPRIRCVALIERRVTRASPPPAGDVIASPAGARQSRAKRETLWIAAALRASQ